MTESVDTQALRRSQIRVVEDLAGPCGRLEALLNTGWADAPYVALVCHPHPPSGGTMHTKAVYHAMKAFSSFGLPVLRFNFRGTGLSDGRFDEGRGEQQDVRASLDWLERSFGKPLLVAGFSFGAAIGLRAACGDPRVQGFVGLGLPVRAADRDYTYEFLPRCQGPKLFVTGDQDIFGPRDAMEEVLAKAAEPKRVVWIAGADHFFAGTPASPDSKLETMQTAIKEWLRDEFALG